VRPEGRGASLQPAALRRWIPVGVVVAILAAVAAMVIARQLFSSAPPARPAPQAKPAPAFVRFRDPAGGISIERPAGWTRVASPNPEVRLLAEGDSASMLVRMTDLGFDGPANLDAARRLTDKLVRTAEQAKLLRPPKRVNLGGLQGYLYLYTFRDAGSGERGAHAHYFLFRGHTLITIVFQTASAQTLTQLAPLFDRLGETLRTTRG